MTPKSFANYGAKYVPRDIERALEKIEVLGQSLLILQYGFGNRA